MLKLVDPGKLFLTNQITRLIYRGLSVANWFKNRKISSWLNWFTLDLAYGIETYVEKKHISSLMILKIALICYFVWMWGRFLSMYFSLYLTLSFIFI
jgi:hypothetical protein